MASNDIVRSRVEGLLAQPVDDELVIYDPDTEHAHVLNPIAYAVWEHARQGATIAQLVAAMPDGDEAAVRLAVADLDEAGLLLDTPEAAPGGMSRRALIRRLGIAAVAAPFVTTILTQQPAAAVGQGCAGTAPASCGAGEQCVNNVCYKSCNQNDQCSGWSGPGQTCAGCCCSSITGSSGQVCNSGGSACAGR